MSYTKEFIENNPKYSIVKFTMIETDNESEKIDAIRKILEIIAGMLSFKKPFAFCIDLTLISKTPVSMRGEIISFLREHRQDFEKSLICSAVIFNNSIRNRILSGFLNGIITVYKPTRPNKITCNLEKAKEWMNENVKLYFK